MTDMKGNTSGDMDIHVLRKEWDEASCPICMDHPHNAVLLLCSSHEKRCRSYICDTSYRHSNCLDRFKKLRVEPRSSPSQLSSSSFGDSLNDRPLDGQRSLENLTPESIFASPGMRRNRVETHDGYSSEENNDIISAGPSAAQDDNSNQNPGRNTDPQRIDSGPNMYGERTSDEEVGYGRLSDPISHLKCPLCRGTVVGFQIVKEARQYLDLKQRSCSREACSFTGNYRELRRHARRVHPTTRPADVDPSRQRAWRHLEHQRENGDIVSAIRSAMPGAVVLGDYVIDNGDRFSSDGENGPVEGSGPWWTTFFLFHMIGPVGSLDDPRRFSRSWTRYRRSSGAISGQRTLWGENLLGLQDDDEWNLATDGVEDDVAVPRRRRRMSRSRSEDHP